MVSGPKSVVYAVYSGWFPPVSYSYTWVQQRLCYVQTTCRRRADDDGRRRTLRRDGAKCRYSIRALRQSPHPRIARRSFPDDLLLFHAAGTMRRCRLIAIMLVSPTHYLLTCLRLVICRSGCAQHMSINAVG